MQSNPRVYVDFWDWTSDPNGEKPYLTSFLSSVGATPWLATVNQYGGGPLPSLLAGTWSDIGNPIPASPTDTQIQQEAVTAINHFGAGKSVNVSIVVALPTGHAYPNFPNINCAYHSEISAALNATYTALPYMTDGGAACDEYGVNSKLDGVSILEGHELAETITNPLVNMQNAWIDATGHEIGDKCWNVNLSDITTSAGTFAVQSLWSNAANGCVLSTSSGSSSSQAAFEGTNGDLWLSGHSTGDQGYGMASGTSPAITSIPSSGYEEAFQANTGSLWAVGALGGGDQHMAMWSGTSPAIAGVAGGYKVAIEGSNGDLWLAGTAPTGDQGFGMAHGTSPAIANVTGGYEEAFQANTGSLWIVGALGGGDQHQVMWPGTSPAIIPVPGGGYEVAFEGSNGDLWLNGTLRTGDQGYAMAHGTSPAIANVAGGYEVAFQGSNGNLWVVGTLGGGDQHLPMWPGTRPAIISALAGWQVAFQASNGDLWLASPSGTADQHLTMMPGTSPSISP